jgi:hypothetical protein
MQLTPCGLRAYSGLDWRDISNPFVEEAWP